MLYIFFTVYILIFYVIQTIQKQNTSCKKTTPAFLVPIGAKINKIELNLSRAVHSFQFPPLN